MIRSDEGMTAMRTSRASISLLAALLSVGCGRGAAPEHTAEPSPPEAGPGTAALPISPETLRAVCSAEPCGGPECSVEVLRDGQGTVRRLLRNYGPCSSSPAIYFDESGRQTELIPLQPVVMGSPEQLAFKARADAQEAGLTRRGETIRCSDGLLMFCTSGHGCVLASGQ
jgi:hypothetical protein